ncbi:LPXTG cell wall anchor domain-containing protein [Streptomyces kaniharaensis]|uniref:LPXTG cell wall anchor domain-containing protein n=1 Tax=Streptomyces kaniharaensis TaxID=212423 RepID=A0A6N7L4C5_9ACTN|nr:LPXTG cell wall anchor domain-containing protein [Streptomyces kaniharaensis]MQS17707.1 LPXTG cell wall anchor domain-containing protein [Streptomyces kaniharaensis]
MHIRSTAARSLVAVPTAAALMLLAPAAHAAPGGKGAPGNNGTVKIHDAATGQEDTRNEPKVCTFYLDSFGFDPGQDVIWMIAEVKGNKEEKVAFGDLPVDENGDVRTEDIELPDGHYKLYWASVQLVDGELPEDDPNLNNPKHKVFKVDCGGKKTPAPTGEPSPTATATPSKSPTALPSSSPTHTPSATATPTAKPSDTPTAAPKPPVPPTQPATPSATASATAVPTTPATGAPTAVPSSPAPSSTPTATVPVQTPPAGTTVNPDKPLIMPAKVSVPTPIKGAPASDGKKLASTGSDGTLLVAGVGTVLVLGGAGLVYARRTRRSS